MKENVKGILFLVGALVAGAGAYYLYTLEFLGYAIVCVTIAVILIVFGIKFLLNSGDPAKVYESNVRNILNTFDSILVKSNTVPKLIGRNIIIVEEMDDMVDAQLEIRKPICYYKQTESCSFVLLDDKEAYVYVEKINPDVVSPVEIEIDEIRLKQKNSEDLDSEMLKDIEKTTIVKLANKKSYKVSPIKKENKFKLEEDVKEEIKEAAPVASKKKVTIDDAEVL